MVGVLVFVDQNVAKTLLPSRQHFGPPFPETHRLAHEIVEIESVKSAQRGAVLGQHDGGDFVVVVPFPFERVFVVGEKVLDVGDAGQDGRHVVAPAAAYGAQDFPHRSGAIRLVEDRELSVAKPQRARLPGNDSHAEAVER